MTDIDTPRGQVTDRADWTPPGFTRRYVDADGVRLHCVCGGPQDGPLVVLLHGWPQTWYAWRHVMPPLADAGLRVAAVDYRGAGDSDRPWSGYEKAVMAGDIRALVGRLGGGPVHLVGRDIGLMVAYAYAAQWPEEVAALVALDVPVPGTKSWFAATDDPQTWHFALHQQRDVAEMLVAGRERQYLRSFYRARLHNADAVSDADIDVYARSYAAPGGLRAGFELYRDFPNDEQRFAEFLRTKLRMPVLAMGGEADNGSMIEQMARELASDVRGAIVPGGGHWSPEENPEFVAAQIIDFLASR
jgi:pimeloyl-ACP methyl ester carboxylesterase